MDPRIKLLSYSSLLTLHACPRKFQLYRLGATEDDMDPSAQTLQTLTFCFGHTVGEGIQMVLQGRSEEEIILTLFLCWYSDLEDRNEKQHKSFYLAIAAIQRFIAMREAGFLDGYELVYYKGKPAVELGFRITMPDGFVMRGSVDAVLQHRDTGKVLVLEAKTSSATNLNPATFKHSSQGIGYSVVLDVLFKDISSYEVLYLVYLTKQKTYEALPFVKSYLQRANWIQELLLDIETIKLYENAGVYPMRGESCYNFFRECEYLNVCTLSTKHLTKPMDVSAFADDKTYDVELTMNDLIMGQLEKNQAAELEFAGNAGYQKSDEMTPLPENYNPHLDELL